MRAWGKEPVLLDNDLSIMVLRQWQLPHPSAREREPLVKHAWAWLYESASSAPQDKGFLPFTSWTVPFTLLCLAALYPLLLHFQGNHCSKSHYFGHITALHSTSPCASSCRVVVVNICRLHSCSGHWKRERDADLTPSQASFTYFLTWVMRDDRTLVIGNVQSVSRYSASSLPLGSQLLSLRPHLKRRMIYI